MKLKGLSESIKKINGMQEVVMGKIDDIDWDGSQCDTQDERLNQVWDALEEAKNALKEVQEINPNGK